MLRKKGHHNGKNQLAKKVAAGAAGLAVVSGAIAGGAAMMDKETRDKVGEATENAIETIKGVGKNLKK